MPKISRHRNYRKTYRTPSRPFEKERLDQELKLLGEYGLRCKREIWRVQYALSKLRKAARELLTLDAKDPKRLFEGAALLRRLKYLGLLTEEENELDFVLRLNIQKLLERRLQTKVFKQNLAKSIHHARVLIKQRHIRVGKQLVDVPSFMVRIDSEKHIDFAVTSPYGQGRPVRYCCCCWTHGLTITLSIHLCYLLPLFMATPCLTFLSLRLLLDMQGRVARRRAAQRAAAGGEEEDDE